MTILAFFRKPATIALSGLALASLLGATGCGAVDNAFDCNAVCTRYRDCFDRNYDVASCRTRCDNRGTATEEGRREVNRCDACISGLSCTGAVFQCAGECGGIVP